jgi:hypothetical protein
MSRQRKGFGYSPSHDPSKGGSFRRKPQPRKPQARKPPQPQASAATPDMSGVIFLPNLMDPSARRSLRERQGGLRSAASDTDSVQDTSTDPDFDLPRMDRHETQEGMNYGATQLPPRDYPDRNVVHPIAAADPDEEAMAPVDSAIGESLSSARRLLAKGGALRRHLAASSPELVHHAARISSIVSLAILPWLAEAEASFRKIIAQDPSPAGPDPAQQQPIS